MKQKRTTCNKLIYDLCDRYGAKYIYHENLSQIHFIDGIHLSSDGGIAQYVRNLKEVINPLLGVISENQSDARKNNFRSEKDRYNHNDDFRNYRRYRQYETAQNPHNNMRNWNDVYYPNFDHTVNSDINMKLLKLALEGWK